MGSGESSGALQLELESPNIQAGDTVSGNVHLLVTAATPGTDLILTLRCDESTEWSESSHETDWTGKRRHKTIKHVGNRNILTQQFVVFSFGEDGCLAGQYSFPIEIQTQKTMCGSFVYEPIYIPFVHEGPTVAKISYQLTASVVTPSNSITPSCYPLYVTHPTDTAIVPISTSLTANISTWYWSSQGSVSITVRFDKNAYIPGETARVFIGVDNSQCALRATRVSITLRREIEMRDNRGAGWREKDTINRSERNVVIEPGQTVREDQLSLDLVIPSDKSIENTTTVSTPLVNCVYTMTVEVSLDGWFTSLGELPQITRPIVIYPQPLEAPALPEVVQWNPKVMPRRQFSAEYCES